MQFSSKLDAYEDSVFTALAKLRGRLTARGTSVIDLSIGSPDQPPPAHVMQALSQAAMDPANYRYAVRDRRELLCAAAAWYARRFEVALDPESQITSLLGSQDGLAHIAQALLDPGDTVLTPDPGYPIFSIGPALSGMRVVRVPLRPEAGYALDFDALSEGDKQRAKLLICSYPGNPVTALAPPGEFQRIVAFAQQYGVAVLHDNAYSELTFDNTQAGSFLQTPGAMDIGVEFNSLSKTYQFAGARLGFALGNTRIIHLLKALKSHLDFGVFLPVQHAAEAALNGPQAGVGQTRDTYCRRRDVLLEGLASLGWVIEKPKATMFVWAPLPQGWSDAQTFADRLAEQAGVLVVPGTAFGPGGQGYVRLALVASEALMDEAVARISRSGLLAQGNDGGRG